MVGADVRWRQRFENFSRAAGLLRAALEGGPAALNDLEKEGAVQRFEYTVELAWKVLKDFLEHSGVQLSSVTPKNVVKAAFASRLIADGQLWIDMLDHRNALSHKYDPTLLGPGLEAIRARYLPALEALQRYLQEQPE
jgi:nucleotidyltransferase substrate binding protein (TIGR01987 family)